MKRQFIFWSQINARKKKMQHLFTQYKKGNKHPTLTREWLEPRLLLWKNTALASILNQTIDNFQYWILCDPRTDDIFDDVIGFDNLDPRVKIIHSKLAFTPEATKQIQDYIDYSADQWFLVRLDSDDYYHPMVLEDLDRQKGDRPFYSFHSGFSYNFATKQFALWEPLKKGQKNPPPFYCHVYSKDIKIRISHDNQRGEFKDIPNYNFVTGKFPPKIWMEPNHDTIANYGTKKLSGVYRYIYGCHDKNSKITFDQKISGPIPKDWNNDRIIEEFQAHSLYNYNPDHYWKTKVHDRKWELKHLK